jgi:WD40 repeat protein
VCLVTVTVYAQVPGDKRVLHFPEKHVVRLGSNIFAMAVSPDGAWIACSHRTGMDPEDVITLWDLNQGKRRHLLKGHGNVITRLAFSRDGKTLVSTSTLRAGSPQVLTWEVATGILLKEANLEGAGSVEALSADGKILVTGARLPNRGGKAWNLETEKGVTLEEHTHSDIADSTAISTDGTHIANVAGDERQLTVWEFPSGKKLWSAKPLQRDEHARVAFSPDTKMLAVARFGHTLLFDVATGKETGKSGGRSTGVQFSPDGKWLAFAATAGWTEDPAGRPVWEPAGVSICSVARKRWVATLVESGGVGAVAFSADGRVVIAKGNQAIHVWDMPKLVEP